MRSISGNKFRVRTGGSAALGKANEHICHVCLLALKQISSLLTDKQRPSAS